MSLSALCPRDTCAKFVVDRIRAGHLQPTIVESRNTTVTIVTDLRDRAIGFNTMNGAMARFNWAVTLLARPDPCSGDDVRQAA